MQHGRDDAGRAIGRRRHHLTAGRILFVDRQRKYIDPIESMHGARRVAAQELAMELGARRRTPARRQQALGLEAAAHAILHDLPYPHEPARISASLRQVRSRASTSS